MKLKSLFTLLALIITSYSINARDLVFDSNFFIRNGKFEMLLGKTESFVFEVNPAVLREIFTSNYEHIVIKQFPLPNSQKMDLKLERAMIPFDQNTEFYVGKKGSLIKTKAPTLMVLSGKIVGLDNSFVFLTVTELGTFGTIQESDGVVHSITPNIHSKMNEHILLNANAIVLNEENIFKCFTEDFVGNSTEAEDLIKFYKYQDAPLAKKPLLEVRLACEGTNDFFKIFGDSRRALAYMTAVIAQSSKIYQEFFNVRLYIGYAVVWEDEWDDPYYGTKNLSEKLQKMPSIWRNKPIDRALTVLFANLANQPSNETVAGISFGGTPYYGSLCNKDWGYCVLGIRGNAMYPTLNYTWDVNVATHEIGHNFSLPHTHNCYWQPNMIDTCVTGETYGVGDACIKTGQPKPRPGTIMSYCHLTNPTHSVQLIFHPRELPLARTAAERSKCVSQVTAPYISLLNPLGDKTYVSGEVLPIRWTSANVNYLTIFFSSDKGATWSLIADNVPAPDSIYLWTLPFINTNNALIYIRDKGNPNIADTSLKVFSIKSKTLQITSPTENEEFAVGETIKISWNATLVDTFNLYFSLDAGKNYSILASNMIQNY
ncbi:MAG: M12 family metallo-peptidase, partial [Candidatus Kapaibacteriota bacterium]